MDAPKLANGSKEVMRIFIESPKTLVVTLDVGGTKGISRMRFNRSRFGGRNLSLLMDRVGRLLGKEFGVPHAGVQDNALVRGYVMAAAEFARAETTPARALQTAGITRETAVEAGVIDCDLEVLDEGHWPEVVP